MINSLNQVETAYQTKVPVIARYTINAVADSTEYESKENVSDQDVAATLSISREGYRANADISRYTNRGLQLKRMIGDSEITNPERSQLQDEISKINLVVNNMTINPDSEATLAMQRSLELENIVLTF